MVLPWLKTLDDQEDSALEVATADRVEEHQPYWAVLIVHSSRVNR